MLHWRADEMVEEHAGEMRRGADAAMAVIDRHPGRTRKQLFTQRQGGAQLYAHEAYNEQEEAQFVVDTTGTAEPSTLEVSSATRSEFVDAVRAALPRFHFVPGEAGGRRVRIRVQVPGFPAL